MVNAVNVTEVYISNCACVRDLPLLRVRLTLLMTYRVNVTMSAVIQNVCFVQVAIACLRSGIQPASGLYVNDVRTALINYVFMPCYYLKHVTSYGNVAWLVSLGDYDASASFIHLFGPDDRCRINPVIDGYRGLSGVIVAFHCEGLVDADGSVA